MHFTKLIIKKKKTVFKNKKTLSDRRAEYLQTKIT